MCYLFTEFQTSMIVAMATLYSVYQIARDSFRSLYTGFVAKFFTLKLYVFITITQKAIISTAVARQWISWDEVAG